MTDLNLDIVKVETKIAEKYIEEYKNFEDWPATGKLWHVKKYPDDKVEYTISEDKIDLKDCLSKLPAFLAVKLANEIEKHKSTFCQLEYLIRKTNQEDVQKSLILITQHLQCNKLTWNPVLQVKLNILINEKTPLYALGCVAIALHHNSATVNIITTQKMAPICYLFTEICCQSGWKIPLIFVPSIESYLNDRYKNPKTNLDNYEISKSLNHLDIIANEGAFGCTGVVTESADIDSALDVFINSSVTAPWKLERLFIQESIYEDVKGALKLRCAVEDVESCAGAFSAKGKLFVCDSLKAELGDGDSARVFVEAYRTTKELCELLERYRSPALSLWAADSQVSQEVALRAPAAQIWVNDYAYFFTSPTATLPFYDLLYPRVPCFINKDNAKRLKELSTNWQRLTKSERVDIVIKAYENNNPDNVEDDFILCPQNDSFVSVDKARSRICSAIEVVSDGDHITFFDELHQHFLENLIRAAISGRTVAYLNLYRHAESAFEAALLSYLEDHGVPVTNCAVHKPVIPIEISLLNKKLKVITTNFGTIFAN